MQRNSLFTRLGRGVVLATLLVGAVPGVAGAEPGPAIASGDPRAVAVSGNVTTCGGAGLPGEATTVESEVDDRTYLDVTELPDGVTLTGVVVKGGSAYNRYADLGPMPWKDMRAPIGASGEPAEISHWFACGTKTGVSASRTKTPGKTAPKTTATKTSATVSSTAPVSSVAGTAGVIPSPTAATTVPGDRAAAVAQARGGQSGDGLAATGFGGGWLVGLAGLLVVGGAGLLLVPRLRRRG